MTSSAEMVTVAARADEIAESMLAATWLTAIATIVGVVIAGAALVAAALSIVQTGRQMRVTARNEVENSDAQTRPYVGVDITPGIASMPSFDIVIRNHGKTAARGIRISLLDGEFAARGGDDMVGPAQARVFAVPFDLAPGAHRRLLWQVLASKGGSRPTNLGAPDSGTIGMSYEWEPNDGRERRSYTDSIRYDLRDYPALIVVAGTGGSTTGRTAEDHLKNAVKALRAIASHVGNGNR